LDEDVAHGSSLLAAEELEEPQESPPERFTF
jgi:hypothetical protein